MTITAVNTLEILVPHGAESLLEGCIAEFAERLLSASGSVPYDLTLRIERPGLWVLRGYWASRVEMEAHLAGRELEELVQQLARHSVHLQFSTGPSQFQESGDDGIR